MSRLSNHQMPVATVINIRVLGRTFTKVRCPHCRQSHWLPGPPDQVAHCLQHPTRAMYVPDEKEKTNGGA